MFTVSSSSRVRYATGSIMYFSQGIPQGLLGIAIPASVPRADTSFGAVFRDINKVLWVSISLIVMAIMSFDGLIYGYGQALMRNVEADF